MWCSWHGVRWVVRAPRRGPSGWVSGFEVRGFGLPAGLGPWAGGLSWAAGVGADREACLGVEVLEMRVLAAALGL